MRLAVLGLLLFGCSTPGYVIDPCPGSAADNCNDARPLPGQDFAIRVIWGHVYEQQTAPPEVRHLTGAALNCGRARGFLIADLVGNQTCVAGVYYASRRLAIISAPAGDATPLHQTS